MRIPDPKQALSQLRALEAVWNFLLAIALPTVLFTYAGRALDRRWGTSPWMTLIGLFLAFLVAILLSIRNAKRLQKTFIDHPHEDTDRR